MYKIYTKIQKLAILANFLEKLRNVRTTTPGDVELVNTNKNFQNRNAEMNIFEKFKTFTIFCIYFNFKLFLCFYPSNVHAQDTLNLVFVAWKQCVKYCHF